MSADPIAEPDAAIRAAPVEEVIALVLGPERRAPVSYELARSVLPALDELLERARELRGWLVYVVEQDCATNLRTEVRIGERTFTYKSGTTYAIERPDDLHAALASRMLAGDLTRAELDAAIVAVDVPSRIDWRTNNARLNDLVKRGGEVAKAIDRHRVVGSTPATLRPK